MSNYIIAKATPKADDINLEAFLSQKPMPAIRYFVPAYDSNVEIRDAQGGFVGVKTPWFSNIYPDGADENGYFYYAPFNLRNLSGVDATFDDFDAARDWAEQNHVSNVLKHRDPGDQSKIKILLCHIKPEQVTKAGTDGRAELKIILEKWVDVYNYEYLSKDADGNAVPLSTPIANVFYILDEEYNVIVVVHAYGFTFLAIDKWEIIQRMIYRHDAPVGDLAEDPDPFHFKTAAEILLPQVIIGGDVDRSAGKATGVIGDFDRTISNNTLLAEGALRDKRTLFLESAEPLNADVERAEGNIRFDMENPEAKLDLNGRVLTLSGAGLLGFMNIVDNGAGRLIISGDNAGLRLTLTGLSDNALEVSGDKANLEIAADNDSVLNFSGVGVCALNGRLYLREKENAADAVLNVDGKVEIKGDGVNSGHLDIDGKLTAAGADINGALRISDANNNENVVIEPDGTIEVHNLKFHDSEAIISGENNALHFNNDKAGVSGDGDISGRHITAEGKLLVKNESGVVDSGDAEIEGGLTTGGDITSAGALRLTGSQNMDLGGNSLVNCRTISELFKDGLVWFNGEDHYAKVPNHSALNFSGSFTFLLSFRTDKDYGAGDGYLLNKGRDNDDAYYRLYLNTGNFVAVDVKMGGARVSVASQRVVSDGRIHTVLVRCDRNGDLELYLDGIKAGASDISELDGDIENDRGLFIGVDGEETPGKYFQGEMFLARIWSNLLSEEKAVEFSSNPRRQYMTINEFDTSIEYLNDINNWETTGLHIFKAQTVNVNDSADAFEFVNNGGGGLVAYISLSDLNLQLGEKYRLELDVKHIGTSYAWYGALTPTGKLLFDSQASTLFNIDNKNNITIFPSIRTVNDVQQGAATYGTIINSYSNGFQRLAFEFTHTDNTAYLSFDGQWMGGGIYLDNVSLNSNRVCLELSSEGLGEASRWLDSGINQLHADLNAEVLKNTRHAGDLEVTGDLKTKNVDIDGKLSAAGADINGALRINDENNNEKAVIKPDGTIEAHNLKFSDSEAVISGQNNALHFNGDLEITGNLLLHGYLHYMTEEWRVPTDYAGGYFSGYNPPGYCKDCMGIVRLRGAVNKKVSGISFTLPPGYRPQYLQKMVSCKDGSDYRTVFNIYPDGRVFNSSMSLVQESLDGIVFRSSDIVSKIIQENWQSPELLGSWTLNNPLEYFKDSMRVIHLRGMVSNGSGVIFNLPEGYRPQYREIHRTYTGDGIRLCRIDIHSNGDVCFIDGKNIQIGFDGINFGDEVQPWQSPALQNSWVRYGNEWSPPGYFKDSTGIVHLRGVICDGEVNSVIFTLPAGYRPQYKERMVVGVASMTTGVPEIAVVDIDVNGDVLLLTNYNSWVSLNNVTFRAFDVLKSY